MKDPGMDYFRANADGEGEALMAKAMQDASKKSSGGAFGGEDS